MEVATKKMLLNNKIKDWYFDFYFSKKVTLTEEDENKNVIDVVSMSPPAQEDESLDDALDSEQSDMEEEAKSESPSSVHNEILAAHSALMSRFQNFPGPPEALEQVQNTLKQMLTHVSAKQSRNGNSSSQQQVCTIHSV